MVVKPMTFQDTGWNALTTELWATCGEHLTTLIILTYLSLDG